MEKKDELAEAEKSTDDGASNFGKIFGAIVGGLVGLVVLIFAVVAIRMWVVGRKDRIRNASVNVSRAGNTGESPGPGGA